MSARNTIKTIVSTVASAAGASIALQAVGNCLAQPTTRAQKAEYAVGGAVLGLAMRNTLRPHTDKFVDDVFDLFDGPTKSDKDDQPTK